MNPDRILAKNSADDVITIFGYAPNDEVNYNEKTYSISKFREVIINGLKPLERECIETLKEQNPGLNFLFRNRSGITNDTCNSLFEELGVDCKILRLGDRQWKEGRVRIRMEVEFIPDIEELDEPSLDTFRESL
jgi:KGK domain